MSIYPNQEPYPSDEFLVDQFHHKPEKDLFEAALAGHDWFGFGDNHGTGAVNITLDTSSFDGIFSAAESNVQLALDKIDDITTSDLPEGTNLYYTDERVDDRVSSLVQDGTCLTWTYDDGSNTLTGDVSITVFSLTDLGNVSVTSPQTEDVLQYDGVGSVWKNFGPPEAYVSIEEIESYTSDGVKGQWSYGNPAWITSYTAPALWLCVATNTWVDIVDEPEIASRLALYTKSSEFQEEYVSITDITDENSTGVKGQWSFCCNYIYYCIGTNTWVRQPVETSFTR